MTIYDEYYGEGYGIPTPEMVEAVRLVARTQGILLDPVYSGKAMAGLIDLKDQCDIAFGNDPDFDRHGIVTRSAGLMNPNHYLSAAISYLFTHRPGWSAATAYRWP